jgi:dihydrofolate synthase/folylpolyglutamate synthase
MKVLDHALHGLPKFGDGIGLHRVRFLMEACGIDRAEVSRRAIAVTGSNGKGSTARIASELLRAAGGTVGLFTSPHLFRYNERFRIDGKPVDDTALRAAMDRVENAVEAYRARYGDAVGAFEAQFVVALLLLSDCRWLVLEAGIGGRYDPVRLARAPVVGLVSLDLEHTELLGKTLLEIALDKLDATPPNGTAILGETCLPFERQIRAFAELSNITLEFVNPDGWTDRGVKDGAQHFDIVDEEIALRGLCSTLIGRHQINNHAVAIALVRQRLKQSGLWPIEGVVERWRQAIVRVTWPGRLETIAHDPRVVIDVGHTPEGIKAALEGFRALTAGRDAILITGGSKNKDVRGMLAILAPAFARIICTTALHNGLAAKEVAVIVKSIHPRAATRALPKIEDAVKAARSDASEFGKAVYVAGGLFLAAEFAEAWRGGDPSQLRFF